MRRVMRRGTSLVCRVEKNQVAGEGGLNGDFGHFQIADFADEDDVGADAASSGESWRR